ncbi:SsgA family sporulation/cell division regulator [Streptomyces sp. NPDC060334]|uniref:SsgA family sporulation/cell division regulator n=1 Tax=unclassified Streptomyces TaxID=2593676 RepID=UPI0022540D88|nr:MULTISPECIES: SsgA family sporulation/cell division regulator [unclassified Streptomyces]MCX5072487.1 SsgA family sporulation/cell division regulator [Streptomyces sp. NBC_00424]MCX5155979.1 SsgA family sporulation/cell division regulator [Streptomyces sp. NBC_00291]WUD44185.1 SsgA family sporulation/cell division regulator [Streptomyces sp. NBC_00513]
MITVIEQAVQARLVATSPKVETVPVTLCYDRSDPFAVRMAFPALATLEGIEISWTFARELLECGLQRPSGHGDVRVRPYDAERTTVEFHAPEGVAIVLMTTADLQHFLERASTVVPPGLEHLYLDVDHSLAELLRGSR